MDTIILQTQLEESQRREKIIRNELETITRKYNESIMANFALIEQNEKLQKQLQQIKEKMEVDKKTEEVYREIRTKDLKNLL